MVDGGRQVDREARRVDKNEEGRGKKRKEKKRTEAAKVAR